MVTDFRNVGRLPEPSEAAPATAAANPAARIISLSLYAAASAFFIAGLWLMFGTQTIFAPDIARAMSAAFIISAVADVVAVRVLQRVWAERGQAAQGTSPTA